MLARWLGCSVLIALFGLLGGAPRARLHLLARHVAAGQTFEIEARGPGPVTDGQVLDVALRDAQGRRLWRRAVAARGGEWLLLAALPAPGAYRITASLAGAHGAAAEADLTAIAPPPSYYGGVLSVGEFGLPDALQEALRDHGFAVQEGLTQGTPRVIAIADPSLGGGANQAAKYRAIWRAVADGANLVLLTPPAPDTMKFWPFQARLAPYSTACGTAWDQGSEQLVEGLPAAAGDVLRPDYAYDLADAGLIGLESLGQRLLVRAGDGVSGCHAWFRFRFGEGLVTVSAVPVLERASDAYMRRYLMNLLKVAAETPRGEAKPGLAAMFNRELQAK